MGCNCKKVRKLEEKHGTKEEETIFRKIFRFFYKIFLFLLLIILSIFIVPILIITIIYQVAFHGQGKIVLPKFLGKYLKE